MHARARACAQTLIENHAVCVSRVECKQAVSDLFSVSQTYSSWYSLCGVAIISVLIYAVSTAHSAFVLMHSGVPWWRPHMWQLDVLLSLAALAYLVTLLLIEVLPPQCFTQDGMLAQHFKAKVGTKEEAFVHMFTEFADYASTINLTVRLGAILIYAFFIRCIAIGSLHPRVGLFVATVTGTLAVHACMQQTRTHLSTPHHATLCRTTPCNAAPRHVTPHHSSPCAMLCHTYVCMRAHARTHTCTSAHSGVIGDMAHFLLTFLTMFGALAVIGHLFLGQHNAEFSGIPISMQTQFMILTGSFPFPNVRSCLHAWGVCAPLDA